MALTQSLERRWTQASPGSRAPLQIRRRLGVGPTCVYLEYALQLIAITPRLSDSMAVTNKGLGITCPGLFLFRLCHL